jgi:glutamate-ammonia-ligase adenylyltransferase
VNSLSSYRDYYRKRAMLWEIQSLSRFRPIAGDRKTIDAFSKMALPLLNFSETPGVNAYKPDWKQEIHNMRMRIEKERTPAGKDHLAIKTGRGGLMDVEFVAQTLALKNGWHEPNTLAALARAGTEKNLSMQSAKSLIDNYKKLMEIERILRRWSFEAESVLPVDPAPFYRVSVRCGFQNPEEFQKAVNEYRRTIRSEYERFFLTAEKAKEPRAKKPSARKKPKRS